MFLSTRDTELAAMGGSVSGDQSALVVVIDVAHGETRLIAESGLHATAN